MGRYLTFNRSRYRYLNFHVNRYRYLNFQIIFNSLMCQELLHELHEPHELRVLWRHQIRRPRRWIINWLSWVYLKYYQDNRDINEKCNNFVRNGLSIRRLKSKFMHTYRSSKCPPASTSQRCSSWTTKTERTPPCRGALTCRLPSRRQPLGRAAISPCPAQGATRSKR